MIELYVAVNFTKGDSCAPGTSAIGFGIMIRINGSEIVMANTCNEKLNIPGRYLLTSIKALEYIRQKFPGEKGIILHTDLTYIVDVVNTHLAKWKVNGWKKTNGKPAKNREQWEKIDILINELDVQVRNTKSDNPNMWNLRKCIYKSVASGKSYNHEKKSNAESNVPESKPVKSITHKHNPVESADVPHRTSHIDLAKDYIELTYIKTDDPEKRKRIKAELLDHIEDMEKEYNEEKA